MPMTYAPPEVALEHAGKTIYHSYEDGDMDNRLTYWFNTDFAEGDEFEFDVRELKAGHGVNWDLTLSIGDRTRPGGDLHQVLRCAIDDGEIVFPADPPQTVTLYVLDDGETYGGGAFVVEASPEQHERICEGEKVYNVISDWDHCPLEPRRHKGVGPPSEARRWGACRTCGDVYPEGGDGYDGECPSCADKTYVKEEGP
jgi:hypothetical protein